MYPVQEILRRLSALEAVIQYETAAYPAGVPVTFRFQGRASGGSGADMTGVACDFSVTERAA